MEQPETHKRASDTRGIRDQLRVDPEILRHQDEWSELYSQTIKSLIESDEQLQYHDSSFDDKPYIDQILTWISYEDRKILQNIWIYAAVQGKAIFYPSDRQELWYYWLYEATLYTDCIDISVLLIVVMSLLESKQCFTESYSATIDSLSFTISSLIFLCSLLQFFDLFLFIKSNHWSRFTQISNLIQQDHTLMWQVLRAISVLVIAINCLIRFKQPTLPNFSQLLIPFLVIPRREDLKQLASGILSAIKQLRTIFQVWGLFIILWAFFGFCLLRRYDESSDGVDDDSSSTTSHFSTYFKSLYVCFHCVLSRPTVLYRLKPIFSQNNFTAFYFVFLTIFGDILISALVIAMGTRAFRQFSRQNLNGRLCYRQRALLSIFSLYSSDTEINSYEMNESHSQNEENIGYRKRTGSVEEGGEGMTFIQWYNFCMELPHDLRFQNEKDIRVLFLLEDKNQIGVIRELQFIRLCAVVTKKLIFFTSSLHSQQNISNTIEQTRVASFKNDNVVRRYLQDVALQNQLGDNTVDHAVLLKSLSEISERRTKGGKGEGKRDSTDSTADKSPSMQESTKQSSFLFGFFPRGTSMNSTSLDRLYSETHFHKTRSTDIYYFRDSLTTFLTQNSRVGPFYKWFRRSIFRWYYFHFIINNPFYRPPETESESPVTTLPFANKVEKKPEVGKTADDAAELSEMSSEHLSRRCSNPREHSSSSSWFVFDQPQLRISAFLLFQGFINVLLVIQTSTLSAKTKTVAAIVLGWFLFFMYCFEAVVLTVVFKRTKLELKVMWTVNLFHFLLYCLLGSDVNHLNQTILTLIIVLQSLRFIQCITNFIIFRSFLKIMPVLQRAVVFYSMILYSFAWIGHMTLCGLMDNDDVVSNDDDARGWGAFSDILNFNTIFSSYYTVAIAAILSNWSMIMDAALASNKQAMVLNWIYFYFFSYRFITVLILLPLLMSCVIQTYMQYFTREAPAPQPNKKEDKSNQTTEVPSSTPSHVFRGNTRNSYIDKLSLDYFHVTIKYKETDSIAALWSSDGKAKVSVVKAVYGGKYGVVIEDLFNQEVIDSLDHQINNTKELIYKYYQKDLKHFHKNKQVEQVIDQYHSQRNESNNDTNYNPLVIEEHLHQSLRRIPTSSLPPSGVTDIKSPLQKQSAYRDHLFKNHDVMLFQLSNAMLIRKQIKWMKEYHEFEKLSQFQNYQYINLSRLRESRSLLSEREVGHLSAIWFEDAIQSFPLIYPSDSFSLKCLSILHSYRFTLVLYIFSLLQMLAVFLIIPQCFLSGEPSQGSGSPIISLQALGIFDACCVVIYVVDILLDFYGCWNTYRTFPWFELNGKSWLIMRSTLVGFILWKSIFSIADADSIFNNLRIVRIFFPILVIARSSNFSDILYGIGLSMKETKPVYILFAFFLFIFTFSGFWLFQRFETHAGRFITLFHSVLTILQCSTSAPFSLYVLLPYYDVAEITPIFFLLLSYAAEILCINLIIGTGNVFFNRYGETILSASKEKQFNSFLAIFFLLSDAKQDHITFKSFLTFCAHLPSRYFATSYEKEPKRFEETLFSLLFYVKKDVLLLNDMIYRNSDLSKGGKEHAKDVELEEIYLRWKISREEFMQLLFIIFNGVVCEIVSHQQKRISSIHINRLFSSADSPSSSVAAAKSPSVLHRVKEMFRDDQAEKQAEKTRQKKDVPERYAEAIELSDLTSSNLHRSKNVDSANVTSSIHNDALMKAATSVDSIENEKSDKKLVQVSSTLSTQIKEEETLKVAQLQMSEQHNLVKYEIPLRICEITIKNDETSYFSIESFQAYLCCGYMKIHREYFIAIISWCQYLCFQQILISKLQPISILDVISFFIHFLLLIQLIYFSSITLSNSSWLIFGYFLEFMFWVEMIIRIIAFGELRFFSDSVQVVRGLINLFALIFMILMDQSYANTTNGYFLLVVTLQCFRLFLFCTRIRGNGRYRLAIKNTSRALSLLLLILYFWTIIAQEVFCGVLSDDTVTGSPTADDDATNWNQFSHILNFNNYQQTLFTLFEVTVLGSWSMVMDATAREASTSAIPLLFFFTFRILMTLVILPMLMSFMVRSFIALYDQIAFVRKHKQEMYRLYRERNLTLNASKDFDENNNKEIEEDSSLSKQSVKTLVEENYEDRNFYNPLGHLQSQNLEIEEHDTYEDDFHTVSSKPYPQSDNSHSTIMSRTPSVAHSTPIASYPDLVVVPPSSSIERDSSQSIFQRLFGGKRLAWFHFRPPKQTTFFSSLPYIELWDMLALKEADDNALYHPMENQILLNLENYRLQLQYYSYLLYLKLKDFKNSQKHVSSAISKDNSNEDENDRDDIYANHYFSSPLQSGKDLHEEEEEDNAEGSDAENEDSNEEGGFSESLFEKRVQVPSATPEFTRQEKREKKERKAVKKRLSHLLQEIKSISDTSSVASSSLTQGSIKAASENKDELTQYYEEVETLLQINHSLNQVIHNVFIDFHKDYQQMVIDYQKKKISRNSLAARFSLFNKEEDN